MKYLLQVLFFLLFSCAQEKDGKNSKEIEVGNDSFNTNLLNDHKIKKQPKQEFPGNHSILKEKKKVINAYENKGEIITENEFGNGDCWTNYRKYKINSSENLLIIDKMDCGDYGFTKHSLIQTKNSIPICLEKIKKEWNMVDSIPYFMMEWLIDFEDTTVVYFRAFKTAKYELAQIPDSIHFSITKSPDINISSIISEMKKSEIAGAK